MSLLSGTQPSGADASANNDKDNRQDSAGEKIKSCAAATDEGTSHPRVMQAAVIEVKTMREIFFYGQWSLISNLVYMLFFSAPSS